MRARSLSVALCALLAVAGTVAAQSFTQEFDDINLLPGQGWVFDNNSAFTGTTSWAPLPAEVSPRDRGEFQGNDTVFPAYSGGPTAYIVNPTLAVGGYPEVWTQFTATVTGAPAPTCGRFAFRYYVTNGGPSGSNSNYIGLDLVEFTTDVPVELQSINIE
jgi:hypothetical protein